MALNGSILGSEKRLDELMTVLPERQTTDVSLPRPKGQIRLESLGFSYPSTKQAQIQQINGQIGPGGMHAIVGPNGSGKTTLLKLLRGLYPPSEGRILIDGADIAQFSQQDLSRHIGFLSQQVQLISGTVRENLTISDEDIQDSQIVQAAQLADAHRFIIDLPDGYGTQVGEGGIRFSGGQRKRLAIAQTLIHNPPILLLDEPTSDLDPASEIAFIESIKTLAKDHTIVVVTHSRTLLSYCSSIQIMDKGTIVAGGKAGEMLPKLGIAIPKSESVKEADT